LKTSLFKSLRSPVTIEAGDFFMVLLLFDRSDRGFDKFENNITQLRILRGESMAHG
jgi:hypothetical protein